MDNQIIDICKEIINKINGLIKNFSGSNNHFSSCDNRCLYYEMYRKDNQHFQEGNKDDVRISISKLIKENEKYFLYEIEYTTFDCIVHHNSSIKTLSYSHKISYEIFEKYGIFMHTNDLGEYVDAPRHVKNELRKLIYIHGIEKVTEEIAVCLKNNYPNRFGISIVCDQ